MSAWSDLFNELIYGNGAVFGLAIIALIGVIAISKARASGIVFVVISGMLCLNVITNAGNELEILTGAAYGFLIPFFMLAMALKGKNGF